jgi:hypothetical protein
MAEQSTESGIEHLGGEDAAIMPPPEFEKHAVISGMERYRELYERSVERPRRVLARDGLPSTSSG